MRLCGGCVGKPVFRHPTHDAPARPPPLRIHLVAADVHVFIREYGGHFLEQRRETLLYRLVGRIETRFVYAEALRWRELALPRTPLRQRREPACHVSRHVDLGHDANTPLGCVGNESFELVARVILAATAEAWQVGAPLARKAKSLIVRQ